MQKLNLFGAAFAFVLFVMHTPTNAANTTLTGSNQLDAVIELGAFPDINLEIRLKTANPLVLSFQNSNPSPVTFGLGIYNESATEWSSIGIILHDTSRTLDAYISSTDAWNQNGRLDRYVINPQTYMFSSSGEAIDIGRLTIAGNIGLGITQLPANFTITLIPNYTGTVPVSSDTSSTFPYLRVEAIYCPPYSQVAAYNEGEWTASGYIAADILRARIQQIRDASWLVCDYGSLPASGVNFHLWRKPPASLPYCSAYIDRPAFRCSNAPERTGPVRPPYRWP